MELIITEKPSSAEKIATALADNKPVVKTQNKVKYYELRHDGKEVVVVPAVGHVYTVTEKDKSEWTYPVFSVHWMPSYEVSKNAEFSKRYVNLIKSLAKEASEFTVATDFDIEGEVIGYNILRFACRQKDGHRMKFSTVTKDDLIQSYREKHGTIDWGQAKAGLTRHELDWYYGINLSRALTLSIKAIGSFKLMSSGRVQGPALKILVDKEHEIEAFKPEPFWQLELHTPEIVAMHEQDKFWKEAEATTAQGNVKDKAKVEEIQRRRGKQMPPPPFDLTTLQTEAYRSFRMNPKETLGHAQDLYSQGYISYPRTSSQVLPKGIDYSKIIRALGKQKGYKELAEKLLKQKALAPNNGKKTDPAHPAIYPTGIAPSKARERAKRVYDIIARRFMATFGEPAMRETVELKLESGGERFITKGTRTIEPGWFEYYGPHVKLEEQELPALKEEQELKVEKTELLTKETQPPKRYTPSSIIKELEKRGLGTKATRADIIDNLYSRGYIQEQSITASILGIRTVDTLAEFVPEILDEKLTRQIEEELEKIREDKIKPEEVLEHAKNHLLKLLDHFKKNEKDIGAKLLEAQRETQDLLTVLGPCKTCNQGNLQIRRGKFGMFVGCTNYPDCTQTYALPSGNVRAAGKDCDYCEFPLVKIMKKRGGPRNICFNLECPEKKLSAEAEAKRKEVEEKEVLCPKCQSKLVIRRSAYGTFIGCSGFPKCRYLEALQTEKEAKKEL